MERKRNKQDIKHLKSTVSFLKELKPRPKLRKEGQDETNALIHVIQKKNQNQGASYLGWQLCSHLLPSRSIYAVKDVTLYDIGVFNYRMQG